MTCDERKNGGCGGCTLVPARRGATSRASAGHRSYRFRFCNGASCQVESKIPLMWLTSGCRLGIYRRVNRSEKIQRSRTDELDARVTGEGDDKNRRSIAIPLPYANMTSLASLTCRRIDAKDCSNRGGTSGRTGR
ncbi:hypothetical protein ALC60_03427 [Trachymyrmex zeteki]|uniref:Uncharacterized protein n=1 Tax=Mycetomoellerius zeteki TaxID=64791 RepID=A0A151XAR1_9HYME|nr:hypothetical protein ALC60_03427 [Trachymyrmex zeteki]